VRPPPMADAASEAEPWCEARSFHSPPAMTTTTDYYHIARGCKSPSAWRAGPDPINLLG
jgi:hypothetical protein